MSHSFTVRLAVLIMLGLRLASAQVTLTDDLKRPVKLAHVATRVVSLAPSITESLFAIGAGNQIVGVTDYCNYPPAARKISRVGGIVNPSIEAIVALQPDVIIISMEGNLRQDFTTLTSLGVPVFVTNPRTLDDIHRSLSALGRLTGKAVQAESLIQSLKARERVILTRMGQSEPSVVFLVSLQPLIAVGARTFINELLTGAHARNIAASTAVTYPMLSREFVIAADPDVILVTSDLLRDVAQLTALFPEWATLSAVRTHRIFRMDADIVSRPGPRATDGLESLYATIHTGSR
jgi:iron complex transport system substrate-binding protein